MRARSLLLLALVACAALYTAMRVSLRVVPAFSGLPAKTEGHFTEGGGWYAGEPFVTHQPVRAWGSWNGSDENTGALTVGPFPAPEQLRFAVGGYPPNSGNTLRIERVGTSEQVEVKTEAVGERWRIIDVRLPAAWRGQPVQIVAVDRATAIGGWLAVTEPIRGGNGDGAAGLWQSLTAWAVNGVLLGLLWFAAVRGLAPRRLVPAPWLPLAALGIIAACALLAFWAWFASAKLGLAFSLLVLLAGAVLCLRAPAPDADSAAEVNAVGRLGLLIGIFYLAILHLLPSSLDFYHLAANRFRHNLPTDNELPYEVSTRLAAGEPLRQPGADWLSSDRPPLQSGWQMLTWPVLTRLGLGPRLASGTASLWLQLGWVAAAFGLLRTFSLSRRRAAAWVAVLATSGFFLQNTTFTWPKLSAAAFASGAFALWVLTPSGPHRRRTILVGAVLAGLAWLSHGGVAFSYLALTPWILWRCVRGEWRHWLLAAVVFGGLAAPWIAYQKFYDPPGNRLLKWHLGGQIPKDARGVGQTLRENYAALPWATIIENKRSNLRLQIDGRWASLVEVDPAQAIDRRNQEFFLSGRALTWWAFGLLLFPLVWRGLRPGAAPAAPGALEPARLHLALFAWTAATVPLWCLLIFHANQAVIHQGSYAMMLGAFVLLSTWFDRTSRHWLLVVSVLQWFTLATTWFPGNPVVQGTPIPLAVAVTALSGLALGAIVFAGWRERPDDTSIRGGRGDEAIAVDSGPLPPPHVGGYDRGDRTPTTRLWDPSLPWLAAGVALLPALWCARGLADLWWFGDDWDLLDQIQRLGFWRWTLLPFAENFVPVFKVLWGGLVFAGGGSYAAMITALWLTHALNTALLVRLLRTAGFGFTATSLTSAGFALASANIESLGWSVQWSALLAITFFLFAALLLLPRLASDRSHERERVDVRNDARARGGGLFLLGLALLSAASALSFARGVLTGCALAAVCLLPLGPAGLAWRDRLRAAAACLVPAVAVAITIALVAPGNHRALGEHWRSALEFGVCYWSATPLHRLLGSVTWHWPFVLALGTLKVALIAWVLCGAPRPQRVVLVALLLFDLGNAVLLGIGRHHTGLPAANSERYYYMALLCTLPFLGLAFSRWLEPLRATRLHALLTLALGLTLAWSVAREWPDKVEGFAQHRGRNTREVLLRQPHPPAENAVPGIPFLPTARAKELIAIYHLH